VQSIFPLSFVLVVKKKEVAELPKPAAPGDLLVCAVLEDPARPPNLLELSCDPSKVNKSLVETPVVAGMLLQGVVRSIKEHALVIDLGLPNLSCVSRRPKNGPLKSAFVGQIVHAAVEKVSLKSVSSSAFYEVTEKPVDHVSTTD
jgi:hypothetical protein